jgi:hypothetical protein
MSRNRNLLAQLLKEWAQEHNPGYQIIDPDTTDQGIINTSSYLTWVVKDGDFNIDLLGLLSRLEQFIDTQQNRKSPDGMFCRSCQAFYNFAEPNQDDGTLLCYSCRQNPYI